jgi:HEAT repeat protein
MRYPIDPLIKRLNSDQVSRSELRELLNHRAALVRVNAVEAIGRLARHDETLVDDLRAAAVDPKSAVRLMGTIAIAHVAVACLLRIGTPKAVAIVRDLLAQWPEPDRSDLLWFVKSEGLGVHAESAPPDASGITSSAR